MPSVLMTDLSRVETPPSPSWARPIRRNALDVQPQPTAPRSTAVAFITALLLAVAAPAFADDPPPTNGGNGAGQCDQCTGNPADRGRFKTPSLRCVSRRPSFMHTGEYRSLEDVVLFFNRGGDTQGFLGVSENHPRDLTPEERGQLVAFLRALDGDGPDPSLVVAPELPPDP